MVRIKKRPKKHHVSKCFIEKPKSKDNLQKTAKIGLCLVYISGYNTHYISPNREKKYFFKQQAGKELKK
jgi:hypothetical protein